MIKTKNQTWFISTQLLSDSLCFWSLLFSPVRLLVGWLVSPPRCAKLQLKGDFTYCLCPTTGDWCCCVYGLACTYWDPIHATQHMSAVFLSHVSFPPLILATVVMTSHITISSSNFVRCFLHDGNSIFAPKYKISAHVFSAFNIMFLQQI